MVQKINHNNSGRIISVYLFILLFYYIYCYFIVYCPVYLFILFISLIWKKEQNESKIKTEIFCWLVHSPHNCAEAGNQEVRLGLFHGEQGHKHFSYHFLSPKFCIRNCNQKWTWFFNPDVDIRHVKWPQTY